ncbi:MAG: Holliday junction resolvase RuvX [Eubacterium sp.]
MRIMGLDYGSKTVGVAISDPLGFTAQGVEIIRRESENKLRKTLARIEQLISEYEVEKIVLGFPKNMDNSIGDRANKSLEFARILEKRTALEVIMQDERLSTVSAYHTMMDAGIKGSERHKYVDQIAATFILQTYLDGLSINKL